MTDSDVTAERAEPLARPATDLTLDKLSLLPQPRAAARRSPVAGKHVLVVGINYAPEPTGIAPYTTGMAEHLAGDAASVTVLCGVPHYPWWHIPRAYRWVFRARERSRLDNATGLLVRRLRHYVPRRQSALTRGFYELSFLANAWAVRIKHSPDLVVAVTPSLGGAVAAARLAARHDAKLVVVVQDLMAKAAAQSGIEGGGRAAGATALVERYALRRADRVAVVSESFTETVCGYGVAPERVRLLPNWTHITPVPLDRVTARRELGWPETPFTVVHTGNIGLKQDLANVVEAARALQDDDRFAFVIVGDGSQRAQVQALGAEVANLRFVDPLDDDEYPKALAAADVLLLNERPGVSEMSLPSKLTSYLSAGRPVLAAVAADGSAARELERTEGAALLVTPGHPGQLATAVQKLHADATLCGSMATAGKAYADAALGKGAATRRLDALLEELLADDVPNGNGRSDRA